MPFEVRGVVEGFYGAPWTHSERLAVVDFIGARGMNAFVYAPKDEAKHRAAWREPYDADELARFDSLAATARTAGVRVAFAVSPGLSIDYTATDDRAALLAKCARMLTFGIDWFVLALDDIPLTPGLAAAQTDLANALLEHLRGQDPAAELVCCPTEYLGTKPSPYLVELAGALAPEIDLLWTGPTVCSPVIAAADAASWCGPLAPHRVLLWDNVPVNDGTMASRLHLGPYEGRDPALAEHLHGVLLNPMNQALASMVTVGSAARFLAAPRADAAHDPASETVEAWTAAIDAVGTAALRPLARACADGAIRPAATLPLHLLIDELELELDGPGWPGALAAIAHELRAARECGRELAEAAAAGDALGIEVRPWAERLEVEARAGLAAARLIQHSFPVASVDDAGQGHAHTVDRESLLAHTFAVVGAWMEARSSRHIVFGPRFAFYPAIVACADGSPALDVGHAVVEDQNAIDRLSRLALALADDRRDDPDRACGPIRAYVDGTERPVAADGAFDADGSMVLLRAGRAATRVGPDPLPCRDSRLR
jgi:hyaluronoglucosaminidase